MTNPIPTAAELVRALEKDGWVEGAPFHLRSWAKTIDEEACASARCPFCDRAGMNYRPFRRGTGYRAVCECKGCGYGYEVAERS